MHCRERPASTRLGSTIRVNSEATAVSDAAMGAQFLASDVNSGVECPHEASCCSRVAFCLRCASGLRPAFLIAWWILQPRRLVRPPRAGVSRFAGRSYCQSVWRRSRLCRQQAAHCCTGPDWIENGRKQRALTLYRLMALSKAVSVTLRKGEPLWSFGLRFSGVRLCGRDRSGLRRRCRYWRR